MHVLSIDKYGIVRHTSKMISYSPDAFWHSKLSDARKCMRLYQHKHVLRTPVVEEKQGDLEFGTAMHLGVNGYLTGSDGVELFEIYWDTCQDVAFGRYNHAELKEMGVKLLTRFERLHLKKFKPYMMEERIFAQIGPHKGEGTPDFLGDFEGIPTTLDFKTSGSKYDKRRIVIETQIPFYAALAKKAHNYVSKQGVYFVFVKSDKDPSIQILKRDLTDSILCDTITDVVEECDDLVARKAFPKNANSCLMGGRQCAFYNLCHKE